MLNWFRSLLTELHTVAYELGNVNVWQKEIAAEYKRRNDFLGSLEAMKKENLEFAQSLLEHWKNAEAALTRAEGRITILEAELAEHRSLKRHSRGAKAQEVGSE